MSHQNENETEEAARLDREYTGNSVNARTPELKKELERETARLRSKYEDAGNPKRDSDESKQSN